MIRFLTIYNNAKDIEKEVIELVYHAHLSYIDCQYMSYFDRLFWTKEIIKIIQEENNVNDKNTLNLI